MSKIIVELGDCSMYDVYRLIDQIKKKKYVLDAYHQNAYFGGLTLHAPDVAKCPACGEALECSTSKCRYHGQVPPRG